MINDESLTFEVTEELILTGVLLGANFQLLKSVYKTYRNLDQQFEHKPMVGAKLSVFFDYEEQTVTFDRQSSQVVLTIPQFYNTLAKLMLHLRLFIQLEQPLNWMKVCCQTA